MLKFVSFSGGEPKCEIGRTRRSLFDDERVTHNSKSNLERRQSVAVMESVKHRTPQKRQKIASKSQHTPKGSYAYKKYLQLIVNYIINYTFTQVCRKRAVYSIS